MWRRSRYQTWAPYVPVAERRRQAAAAMAKEEKKSGRKTSPVVITGRAIASTPWGKAWCANLESYSDYANRLPRGRTYVRNGSVVDLDIQPGTVLARVSGSSVYRTTVKIQPLAPASWKNICTDCAGGIDSLVELLQGRFAAGVMDRLCRRGDGLFPQPKEIAFDCSCPDSARMCKHVAAVLYGIGARFDQQPELLFTLRQVDAAELLSQAGSGIAAGAATSDRALAGDDLGALFGLEMDHGQPEPATSSQEKIPKRARTIQAGATAPPAPQQRGARQPVKARPLAPAKQAKASPLDPYARLLHALRRAGALDNAAARQATGLDATAVRPLLRRLVDEGQAHVTGQKRGTRYVAKSAE